MFRPIIPFADDQFITAGLVSSALCVDATCQGEVWYSRCHMVLRWQIEEDEVKIVSHAEWHAMKYPENQNYSVDESWAAALDAAKKVEDELGEDNLGPWDDFDWGSLTASFPPFVGRSVTIGTSWTRKPPRVSQSALGFSRVTGGFREKA